MNLLIERGLRKPKDEQVESSNSNNPLLIRLESVNTTYCNCAAKYFLL